MIKNLTKLAIFAVCTINAVSAEHVECHSMNPISGKEIEMIESMTELAMIFEKHHDVVVNIVDVKVGGQGKQIDFCVRWDDQVAWAKSQDSIGPGQNKDMTAWGEKWGTSARSVKIGSSSSNNLDTAAKKERFNQYHVFHVFALKAELGRHDEMIARFKQFEKLSERYGNQVDLYEDVAGGTGELWVLMTNESFTALIGSGAGPVDENDKDLQDYVAAADPTMYQVLKEMRGHTFYPSKK